MQKSSLPYCTDCGEARVSHWNTKFTFRIEHAFSALTPVTATSDMSVIGQAMLRHVDRRALSIARSLARRGLGSLLDHCDESRDSIRTKALFDGAKLAGVTLLHFRPFDWKIDGFFIAIQGDKQLVFKTMPRPRGFVSPSLDWMDDKGALKPFLLSHDIPTAQGGVATTLVQAHAIYERVGAPVITKPHHGTRGRHTTIGIKTPEQLRRAFEVARQITPYVIVEQELSGIVHRVTLIGMKVAAVARRDYPYVIGDGSSTLQALLDRENQDPRRDGFAFHPIRPNERAQAQLDAQGLTWNSIPEKGRRVILNDKISRLHGTVTEDVTDRLHPDNLELFNRLGDVLGDPLVGVDFMIGDVARSWKEQPGCGVVECNAMPYIDLHHYPYEGAPRPVAKDLWDYVFANGEW